MKIDHTNRTFWGCRILMAVAWITACSACAAQDQSQDSAKIFEDTAYRIRMVPEGEDTLRDFETTVDRKGDFSSLVITFQRHVGFLVEDPYGHRVGYDESDDTTYNEIPGTPYRVTRIGNRDGEGYVEWTEANIHDPYDADYFLTITKTFAPTYTFTVSCYDYSQMPQPNGIPFSDIPIDSGLPHSYTISLGTIAHAPYEVTGGFAGSANERAEIDRLLSYVNVSENVTALPTGTDRFNLILIYGGMVKPNTFSATLNDEDASDLFTPVDGGYEIVAIPLESGKNLLELSVVGHTPDGAAADTDSLLFVVE